MERGLLINCTVGKVLRFVPPLIVSRAEVDEAVAILDEVLATVNITVQAS
jgi:acetylornithine/succinyldiaminopimelate/putrescine aminotransferase